MATVIDSLIVKLGLDSKEFKQGQKDIDQGLEKTKSRTRKVGKDISANGKEAAEFFGQMQRAAVKFFAVLTTGRGLSDFAQTVIRTGTQLDRVSTRIGESAANLSRWQGAVRQSGGTGEQFLATIQGISDQFTQLKETGDAPIRMLLQQLGVSAADANGKARPILELIEEIGVALEGKQWANADKFNKLLSAGFDEGTANLLMKGSTELRSLLAAQAAYSDADARAARLADERWEKVKLNMERITGTLVIDLIPAFEKISDRMVEFGNNAIPVLSTVLDILIRAEELSSKMGDKIDSLRPRFDNEKAEELFSGKIGFAAQLNPITNLIGAASSVGEYIRSTIEDEDGAENPADAAQAPAPNGSQSPQSGGGGNTRAERNFNPGNLEYRGQSGAVPEPGSGRFAKFNSPAEGVSALAKQLLRYEQRGLDTLDEIINTYAPSNENDTQAYIGQLSRALGVTGSQELDLSDPDVMNALIRGISKHEAGVYWLSDADVMTGLQMAGVGGNTSTSTVSIGEIKVYSQATDATGIARDIRNAMVRQADGGMR